jgi:hypothetical protein
MPSQICSKRILRLKLMKRSKKQFYPRASRHMFQFRTHFSSYSYPGRLHFLFSFLFLNPNSFEILFGACEATFVASERMDWRSNVCNARINLARLGVLWSLPLALEKKKPPKTYSTVGTCAHRNPAEGKERKVQRQS